MDRATAATLIDHAVKTTASRWRQYDQHWAQIDRAFVARGYEQQGFQSPKFVELLESRGVGTIAELGRILTDADPTKYDRTHAGGVDSPFYALLRDSQRGPVGKAFHDAVVEFLEEKRGKKGSSFWRLLWLMLRACRYLRAEHGSSFGSYLLARYRDHAGRPEATDRDLLGLDVDAWRAFVASTKPWKPLPGVGENVFDFLVGDLAEARFAGASYKLDTANEHFLTVTGIQDLIGSLERQDVIAFLEGLELTWTLREINKGLYTYCSVTEALHFGFCRSALDCGRCEVRGHCEQRLPSGGGHEGVSPWLAELERARARIAELEAENRSLREALAERGGDAPPSS